MSENAEVYDTFLNPPPIHRYDEDEWLVDDGYPYCPVCMAPYGSCMDIIFEQIYEENND